MYKPWRWYVYIVECLDGSYYTGMTWRVDLRVLQHMFGGGSKYTTKHGFKRLAYYEEYDNLEEARARELQIKGWIREKKEKLIKGEWGRQ